MKFKCIIFDCDGVLVDSETISARIFMEMAETLGYKMDFNVAVERFAGVSMKENLQFIEDNIKGSLPANFEEDFRKRTYLAFKTDLRPIKGIHNLLNKITVPFCTASSGPVEKIRLNLTTTNLLDKFENKIFSSYEIGSWKPDPGIYLHAAKKMGFSPDECVVIEDSEAGVKAAIAGGFEVYVLANESKKSTFEKLGVNVVFSMDELGELLKID
ncbi:MAG: HAD family hydrolase [Prolixibacteraceae bacterium]|jgi:HAD superfamily hydrolase (TIGR01509 family)|nr:HAD family hydrolase [Prolixibacteraceae bacterium]MBT6004074.1 HAD family hydrolase [Prolixibacteraceae bacterium]MBT6998903.1 HAD family hydrolase [Prolixibacteraceae bacterium]MBT7395179.1 HAD family hydrolase [Prolixibacteraceae bacterium]